MIRLLVVEDSKTVQQALVEIFNSDPGIQVVGTASNGDEAVTAVMNLKPDVVTMDVNMPGLDGFGATRAIMASCPVPIVIVTGKMDPKESATIFQVMKAGALMVTAKPAAPGHPEHEESVRELIRNVKLMSEIKVVRRVFPKEESEAPPHLHHQTSPADRQPGDDASTSLPSGRQQGDHRFCNRSSPLFPLISVCRWS